jgi:hypothetical protein
VGKKWHGNETSRVLMLLSSDLGLSKAPHLSFALLAFIKSCGSNYLNLLQSNWLFICDLCQFCE